MLLPPQYAWFEPVLIAAIIVFIIDSVGNIIEFNNRFVNALVTAFLFAIVFGALVYFGYGNIAVSVTPTPLAKSGCDWNLLSGEAEAAPPSRVSPSDSN
jgi:predicted PurR-regulated permease PerM